MPKQVSSLKRFVDMGATEFLSLTVNDTDREPCKAVYVGVTDDYEFSFDGSTWIPIESASAGTTLPFRIKGVRHEIDESAPNAGEIVLLY